MNNLSVAIIFLILLTSLLRGYGQKIDSAKVKQLGENAKSYNSGDNVSFWSCYDHQDPLPFDVDTIESQINQYLNGSINSFTINSKCTVYQTKKAKRKKLHGNIAFQLYIDYTVYDGLILGLSNLKLDSNGIILNPDVFPNLALVEYNLFDAIELIKEHIPLESIQEIGTYHKNRTTPLEWEFISYPDEKWEDYKRGRYCYQTICTVNSGTGEIEVSKRQHTEVDPKYMNINF